MRRQTSAFVAQVVADFARPEDFSESHHQRKGLGSPANGWRDDPSYKIIPQLTKAADGGKMLP
jgi:hypothetical protein